MYNDVSDESNYFLSKIDCKEKWNNIFILEELSKLNIESKVDKEDEIKKSSYKSFLKSGSKKETIHNEETTIQDIIENINKALDYFITY